MNLDKILDMISDERAGGEIQPLNTSRLIPPISTSRLITFLLILVLAVGAAIMYKKKYPRDSVKNTN